MFASCSKTRAPDHAAVDDPLDLIAFEAAVVATKASANAVTASQCSG
jgi:hypothetical protein